MEQQTLTERVSHIEAVLGPLLGEEKPTAGCDTVFGQIGRRSLGEGERLYALNEEAPRSSFDEIISRIHGATGRVLNAAHRIEEIGNRVMGFVPPEGAQAGDKQREPNGTLEAAFMALDILDGSLSRLETLALRLERV